MASRRSPSTPTSSQKSMTRRSASWTARVVEVEVGLVAVEAVPVVRVRDRVPRPVRGLEVLEDDARVAVAVGRVAPDVEVALGRAGPRAARALEPGVLVGGVVEDELGDDPQAAPVGLADEGPDVAQRAVVGVDRDVVGDVVAVVAQRRGIERQQPDGRDAEVLEVVEPRGQAREVADPVARRIHEGPDVGLVDDRVLVPERVGREARSRGARVLTRRPSPLRVRRRSADDARRARSTVPARAPWSHRRARRRVPVEQLVGLGRARRSRP